MRILIVKSVCDIYDKKKVKEVKFFFLKKYFERVDIKFQVKFGRKSCIGEGSRY